DYEKAIQQIDLALEIIENADLLALKGSIYLAKGSIPEAKTFWEKALKLDKEVPLSHLPGLKKWLVEVGLLK
ncbi:MAG: hypothetical protein U1C46_06090, partial [Bacteroidales bacterium]|nr:hypothetical protein [Bacteroidales bacterium]